MFCKVDASQYKTAMAKRGRPSKYREKFAEQAQRLCDLGATDREVAGFFKINESTLHQWRARHEQFSKSLKIGKEASDRRVETSLYRRALGYSHDAVKIMQHEGTPLVVPYVEHVPPDTTACIFWLKNRRPDLWRDLKAVEHSGAVRVTATELSNEDLIRIAAGGSAGTTATSERADKSAGVH